MKRKGVIEELADGTHVLETAHPSCLLRIAGPGLRERAMAEFRAHLVLPSGTGE